MTDLPPFDSYGNYAAPSSYALPNETVVANLTYKTEDADGYTGDIDMVMYVGFTDLAEGEYNISLSIVQYQESALEKIADPGSVVTVSLPALM